MKTMTMCILTVLIAQTSGSYGQQKSLSKIDFLNQAPENVRAYYRAFDSLAHPTWSGNIYKEWTLGELKKYASMIYHANEYDPIAMEKFYQLRAKEARDAHVPWVPDVEVIKEVAHRLSEKEAALVKNPYWCTVKVDYVQTVPFVVSKSPHVQWSERRVRATLTRVLKGKGFHEGDKITAYYFKEWGYHELRKGASYLVALYPVLEAGSNEIRYALGGPNHVQQSVFPIENDHVLDEDDIFQMGKKVDLKAFIEAMTTTMNEIKSWKENAQ